MTDQTNEIDVRIEWAVDLGFGPCAARDEQYAREWVKSYEDHPADDVQPVLLSRTVTTTPWEPTTSPGKTTSDE